MSEDSLAREHVGIRSALEFRRTIEPRDPADEFLKLHLKQDRRRDHRRLRRRLLVALVELRAANRISTEHLGVRLANEIREALEIDTTDLFRLGVRREDGPRLLLEKPDESHRVNGSVRAENPHNTLLERRRELLREQTGRLDTLFSTIHEQADQRRTHRKLLRHS